jgi:hypothetical protein
MSTRLQVYQLNVRKNNKMHLSMTNDKDLKDHAALAVAEPRACIVEGQVMTAPNHHSNWTKKIPANTRELRVEGDQRAERSTEDGCVSHHRSLQDGFAGILPIGERHS